jgi:hypothetical protein
MLVVVMVLLLLLLLVVEELLLLLLLVVLLLQWTCPLCRCGGCARRAAQTGPEPAAARSHWCLSTEA